MEESSDLLAVVSDVTEKSWWVPFEIGMAAHVNLPMVSFLKEGLVDEVIQFVAPKILNDNDGLSCFNG